MMNIEPKLVWHNPKWVGAAEYDIVSIEDYYDDPDPDYGRCVYATLVDEPYPILLPMREIYIKVAN